MKTRLHITALTSMLIALLFVHSCNKEEDLRTGSVEFGTSQLVESALKAENVSFTDFQAALVTIVDETGAMVYEKEYLPFYSFGNEFVTKSLTLNVGMYSLTEFMLIDSSFNVIWSTPLEGSELASMVNDPLPIEFSVSANSTSRVTPEVIMVGNYTPADFGYVNFDVVFVDNFCIRIYYESLCNQWALDSSLMYANGFAAPYPVASFMVFAEGMPVYETYITPGLNEVPLPYGFDLYELAVFDCGNQLCFSEVFGEEELGLFSCDTSEILYINCQPELPEINITPEDISEPTIEQGIFGMISEPGIDSLPNDDYPVQGYAADLYLYKMEPGDSLTFPAFGSDCYVYPDIHAEPYAIVRSNSEGYYQMPLEAGDYSYMVHTPYGFYIGAWISSRYPGIFTVTEGLVTILNIHVEPCIWF